MNNANKMSGNVPSSSINDRDEHDTNIKKKADGSIQQIEKHKKMYKDSSISAPYSSNPMHIPSKLRLPQNTETMEAVCSYTGICIALEIPRIPGHAFEYQNPLSIYSNVKGILQQGPSYLYKLDSQILAGLFITAYRHYDLMEAYSPKAKTSGAAINAMLRTAGKEILVESLDLINLINSRNSLRLPSMSFDYQAHMHAVNMAPAIKEYTKLIRGILFPEYIDKKDKALIHTVSEEGVAIEERRDAGPAKSKTIKTYAIDRRKVTLTERDREFEELFKRNKQQAKALHAEMVEQGMFSAKFLAVLDSILKNRNLIIMAGSLRRQFIEKLEEKPCSVTTDMIRILRDSDHVTDIFGDVDDAFADAPSVKEALAAKTPTVPMVGQIDMSKMTLRERIAYVRAQKEAVDEIMTSEPAISQEEQDALEHTEEPVVEEKEEDKDSEGNDEESEF